MVETAQPPQPLPPAKLDTQAIVANGAIMAGGLLPLGEHVVTTWDEQQRAMSADPVVIRLARNFLAG